MTNPFLEAHGHSDHHREEILASTVCGCFQCLATFPPSEIGSFGETAWCPNCGVDSVIGDKSGFPVTDQKWLEEMKRIWF